MESSCDSISIIFFCVEYRIKSPWLFIIIHEMMGVVLLTKFDQAFFLIEKFCNIFNA